MLEQGAWAGRQRRARSGQSAFTPFESAAKPENLEPYHFSAASNFHETSSRFAAINSKYIRLILLGQTT